MIKNWLSSYKRVSRDVAVKLKRPAGAAGTRTLKENAHMLEYHTSSDF